MLGWAEASILLLLAGSMFVAGVEVGRTTLEIDSFLLGAVWMSIEDLLIERVIRLSTLLLNLA